MRKTIFVIDDQGHLTIDMILGNDHEIKGFKNTATALAALETEMPDLIFLDYKMPEMNRLELLDQLKFRGIALPVVMCSSEPAKSLRAEALRRGAFDYICKRSNNYPDEIIKACNKFAI